MIANFEINALFSGIDFFGQHFDVDNNFRFAGYVDDEEKKEIRLQFTKGKGAWIPVDEVNGFELVFTGVNYKYLKPDNRDHPANSRGTITEMSFYPSKDRKVNDLFMDQRNPLPGDDIKFHFEDESLIRIGCAEGELIVLE